MATTAPPTSPTSQRVKKRALATVISATRQGRGDRGEALCVANDVVADSDVRAQTLDLVDDLFERSDQHERRLDDDLAAELESLRSRVDLLVGVVADVQELHE